MIIFVAFFALFANEGKALQAESICCEEIEVLLKNKTAAYQTVCLGPDSRLSSNCCRNIEIEIEKHRYAYKTLCPAVEKPVTTPLTTAKITVTTVKTTTAATTAKATTTATTTTLSTGIFVKFCFEFLLLRTFLQIQSCSKRSRNVPLSLNCFENHSVFHDLHSLIV